MDQQQDMDIMEILNTMEDAIDKASTVPLTGKIMLDKDEIMDYIQEIRLVYPDELKEAKWVKSERARILSEAEARAETIQKNAAETQMQLINEHEIYRCAACILCTILIKTSKTVFCTKSMETYCIKHKRRFTYRCIII